MTHTSSLLSVSTDDGESKGYFRRTVFGFGDVKDDPSRVLIKPEFAISDWGLTEPCQYFCVCFSLSHAPLINLFCVCVFFFFSDVGDDGYGQEAARVRGFSMEQGCR
jgi:hypothetical protein